MERGLTSLATWEVQIKTIKDITTYQLEQLRFKKIVTMPSTSEDAENQISQTLLVGM